MGKGGQEGRVHVLQKWEINSPRSGSGGRGEGARGFELGLASRSGGRKGKFVPFHCYSSSYSLCGVKESGSDFCRLGNKILERLDEAWGQLVRKLYIRKLGKLRDPSWKLEVWKFEICR